MLQTNEMQQKLSRAFTQEQSVLLSELIHEKFEELVKTSDFRELKEIVAEVAKQQKETSAEVKSLSVEVKTLSAEMKVLAKQQQETSAEVKSLSVEVKTLSAEMKVLAKQQQETSAEVKSLSAEMKVLAKQQQETSAEIKSLSIEVKALSAEMKELAEQQKKTWAAVEILALGLTEVRKDVDQVRKDVDQIRKEVGGLATTVGYRLEDEAYKGLPALLLRDFNMQVSGRLKRGYLTDIEGNSIEINIIGKAKQHDKNILIIGEAKSQLSKKFVDEFLRKKLNRLPKTEKIFTVLVTYMVSTPDVETYVKSKGIQLYYSYDF